MRLYSNAEGGNPGDMVNQTNLNASGSPATFTGQNFYFFAPSAQGGAGYAFTTETTYITLTPSPAITPDYYVRFAARWDGLLTFGDGQPTELARATSTSGKQLRVVLTPGQGVAVHDQTGTTITATPDNILQADTWYTITLLHAAGNGHFVVNVHNGDSGLVQTAASTTTPRTADGITTVDVGVRNHRTAMGGTLDIDDIVVENTLTPGPAPKIGASAEAVYVYKQECGAATVPNVVQYNQADAYSRAWDSGTPGDNTIRYARTGGYSGRYYQFQATVADNPGYLEWILNPDNHASAHSYGRLYLNVDAVTGQTPLVSYRQPGNQYNATLALAPGNGLLLYGGSPQTIYGDSGPGLYTSNTWYRLQWEYAPTNGWFYWELYDLTGNQIASDGHTTAGGGPGADMFILGPTPLATSSGGNYRFAVDRIEVNNTAMPGTGNGNLSPAPIPSAPYPVGSSPDTGTEPDPGVTPDPAPTPTPAPTPPPPGPPPPPPNPTPTPVGDTPPVVTLTAPPNGATYPAPATVTVTATATDPDGSVTQVAFLHGGILIDAATSPPYTTTWTGVPAGSYTLTAVATDNQGATTTSSPVTVTVTGTVIPPTPPVVPVVPVVPVIPVPGQDDGPTQPDEDEILYSTAGYTQRGIEVESGQTILTGTVMARQTSTGFYAPYNAAGTDGLNVARGVLHLSLDTTRGRQLADLIVRGALRLSVMKGLDTAATTQLGGVVNSIQNTFRF